MNSGGRSPIACLRNCECDLLFRKIESGHVNTIVFLRMSPIARLRNCEYDLLFRKIESGNVNTIVFLRTQSEHDCGKLRTSQNDQKVRFQVQPKSTSY
jgi:hypothetical protein